MQYMGGKKKIGKHIAKVINDLYPNLERYAEPFCGMCSVGIHVNATTKVMSDNHPDTILVLQATRDGWEPPDTLTEEEYRALKEAEPSALRAFAGFGCSFGGKWFGGYGRRTVYPFAAGAKRSLARMKPGLQGMEFIHRSYEAIDPTKHDLIYCDPPYADTTKYGGVERFDSAAFWVWCRAAAQHTTVLVSEYAAPNHVEELWSLEYNAYLNQNKGGRVTERLFLVQH